MNLLEIKKISDLEEIVQRNCAQNEIWKMIVEMEKEQNQTQDDVIAYKIVDSEEQVKGLIQYSHLKGGFLKKEKVVIRLLTTFTKPCETIGAVHSWLMEKYNLSKEFIHVLYETNDSAEIEQYLIQNHFQKKKSEGIHSRYGYGFNLGYFVRYLK